MLHIVKRLSPRIQLGLLAVSVLGLASGVFLLLR